MGGGEEGVSQLTYLLPFWTPEEKLIPLKSQSCYCSPQM